MLLNTSSRLGSSNCVLGRILLGASNGIVMIPSASDSTTTTDTVSNITLVNASPYNVEAMQIVG